MGRGPIVLLMLCIASIGAPAQTSERYTLRGQVVDDATGQPLPDLQIAIKKYPAWQLAAEPVTSGPDGRFVFYGLEEGLYTADTWLYGEVIHNGELPNGTLLARRAGPKFQDSEFTFRVTPRPSIDGIVRDEHGDPVPFVNVWAFRSVWMDSRIVQSRGLPVTTDDRGYYRISALSPGGYMVCAEFMDTFGNEWHRTMAPEASSVVDYGARSATRFYRRSCYPGPPPASFKIEWGRIAHADLKLGSTPVTKVQGRVSDWDPRVAHISLLPEDETASSRPGAMFSEPKSSTRQPVLGYDGATAGPRRKHDNHRAATCHAAGEFHSRLAAGAPGAGPETRFCKHRTPRRLLRAERCLLGAARERRILQFPGDRSRQLLAADAHRGPSTQSPWVVTRSCMAR